MAWLIAAREAVDAVKLELTPLKVLPAINFQHSNFPFRSNYEWQSEISET